MRLLQILTALPAIALAAKLTVFVAPGDALLNPATLSASTHAVLLGPAGIRYDAPIRRDTSFVFDGIAPASYLLTIHAHENFFPPLRVDVTNSQAGFEQISAWQTFRGNEWSNKGPSFGTASSELSIHIRSIGQKEFYQERAGFSILSFLKSPMILMGLVSAVIMFGMPYLMDNLDPEMKAELEEMQKKSSTSGSSGMANQLQNFDVAGFLSGKASNPQQEAEGSVRRR